MAAAGTAIGTGVCFGEKIKILHTSLKSFKDETLAYTFHHTPEIQPTKQISRGNSLFQFLKEENVSLADGFRFKSGFYPTKGFLADTKTLALVVKDNVIKYENIFTEGISRRNNMRFFAVNSGIDSKNPDTLEYVPFINIMSEWYAKDIRKK